jgi:hypothetical protein
MSEEKLTKTQRAELRKEVKAEVKTQVKAEHKGLQKQIENSIQRRILQISKKTASFFGSEFKKQASTALIAAFGFIVALAWRDLITKVVNENVPQSTLQQYPYLHLLYSALIVTFIAAIGIGLISHWSKKKEEKK